MENYIEYHASGNKLRLTETAAENLKRHTPSGCPFKSYTMLDLLLDFVRAYDWKIRENTSVKTFMEQLSAEGYAHARAYGKTMIDLIGGAAE